MNKLLNATYCILLCSLSALQALGQTRPNIEDLIMVSSYNGAVLSRTIQDDQYPQIASASANFADQEAYTVVSLFLDPNKNVCYPAYRRIRVNFAVTATVFNAFGSPVMVTESQTWEVEKFPDLVVPDKERMFKRYDRAYKVTVEVTGVQVLDMDGNLLPLAGNVPGDVMVTMSLRRSRYNLPGTIINQTVSFVGGANWATTCLNNKNIHNVFVVNWATVPEADGYELEWRYVDDFGTGGLGNAIAPNLLAAPFKGASSRVRLPRGQNSFAVPLIYSRGYVLVRGRPLTKGGPGFAHDVFGRWSYDPDDLGNLTVANFITQSGNYSFYYLPLNSTSPVLNNLNAQYSITFSEDGKILPQGSYADGSLRVRQTNVAATVRSDNNLSGYDKLGVVTETIYDFLGRPAVSTLPAATEPGFWYKEKYNVNAAGAKYSYLDFDKGNPVGGECFAAGNVMGLQRGAARYYSPSNPNQVDQQGMVPDAAGYPYTRVIYEGDNASRPKIQSGVGAAHKMGSGHETQYVYGNALQEDLNSLFGTDAGWANYYQKNMIVDANGQVSVTYTDLAGKTVATALAGQSPTQLAPLTDDQGNVLQDNGVPRTADLIQPTSVQPQGSLNLFSPDSSSLTVTQSVLVAETGNYVFAYKMVPEDFSNNCLQGYCADCQYILEMGVMDDCGNYRHGPVKVAIDGLLNDNCAPNAPTQQNFTVMLDPGLYTVTKKLSLDPSAWAIIVDSAMAHDTCLKDLDDFYEAPDTACCFVTCEGCLADLGTLQAFISHNVPQNYPTAQAATGAYHQFKAECEALCPGNFQDFCSVAREMMLQDMSPGGQYGERDAAHPGTYPVSIFDNSLLNFRENVQFLNHFNLPTNPSGTISNPAQFFNGGTTIAAFWRNPRYLDMATNQWKRGYYNADGSRATVHFTYDPLGNKVPAFVQGAADLPGDFGYLEDLASVDDLIARWDAHYAYSLIVYHPEYFKYEYCRDGYKQTGMLDTGNGNVSVNSYQYGSRLKEMTVVLADSNYSGINFSSVPTLSNSIINSLVDTDPFFKPSNSSSLGNQVVITSPFPFNTARLILKYKLQNYSVDSGGITIFDAVRVAAATANPNVLIMAPNGYVLTDATWKVLATIYESEKTEAINIAGNLYQYFIKDTITTGCIGSDAGLTTTPFGWFNLTSPCAPLRHFLYPHKQQRFPSNTGIAEELGLEEPVTPSQLQAYAQAQASLTAGRCPLQLDLELLLTKLAYDGRFVGNSSLNLNNPCILGQALKAELNPLNYYASIQVSSTTLTLTFAVPTGPCPTLLTLPTTAPAGLVWADFYRFHDIHLVGNLLKIWGTYNHNGVEGSIELSLTTCLPNITICTPTPVAICTTTDELKDLKDLMNALSADGRLFNPIPGGYPLGNYAGLLTNRLKDIIGYGGSYKWQFGGSWFKLRNSANPTRAIVITFQSGTTISPPNSYLFTSIIQAASVTSSPGNQSAFTIKAVPNNPGYGLFLPLGTQSWQLNATLSDTNGLNRIYASTCAYPLPMECQSDAHDNLRELQQVLEAYDNGEVLQAAMDSCLDFDAQCANGAAFNLNQVTEFSLISADMTQSQDGLSTRRFLATVRLQNGTVTTIGGWACFDLRNCSPCGSCDEAVISIDFGSMALPAGQQILTLSAGTRCGLGTNVTSTFNYIPGNYPNLHAALLAWAAQLQVDFPGVVVQVDANNVMRLIKTAPFEAGCKCSDLYVDLNVQAVGTRTTGTGRGTTRYRAACCPEVPPGPAPVPAPPLSVGPFKEEQEPSQPPVAVIDPGLVGCHDPIFPLEQDTVVDPCTQFLSDLAYADAYYDYQAYLDSVRSAYMQAYRRKCMRAMETFSMSYVVTEYHYTLYYYDRAGNLVKTVPPKAVTPLPSDAVTNAAVNQARVNRTVYVPEHNKPNTTNPNAFALTSRYRYNSLNQPIAQQSPDGGISRFYYDNLGRVVVSQNAKQVPNRCSYTKYDALGRIAEVGEMTRNTATILSQANFHNPAYVTTFHGTTGYTKGQFVHTYYDDGPPPNPFIQQRNLRSRVAYVTYQPDANKLPADLSYRNASYYSYDYHGNVDKLLQFNDQIPLAGANATYNYQNNTIDYTYDLVSGKVLKVAYNAGKQDRFFHRYHYDDQNRLIEARTSKDDVFYDLDARYFYYYHGPLARVEYGPYKSQGADYAYTIHGWLKSINGDNQSALRDAGRDGNNVPANSRRYVGRDAFGFALQYYQGDYTPIKGGYVNLPFIKAVAPALYQGRNLYNGNIAAMSTTLKNLNTPENVEPLLQVFGYDQLNRIVGSEAYIQNTTQDVLPGWPTGATSGNNLFKTGYSYDALGNIKTLKRHNKTAFMDDLAYSYAVGKNQLTKVGDTQGNGVVNYDIDNQTAPVNYSYDAIGNLVTDASEQIANIQWNVFGKVTAVDRSPGSTKPKLRYGYDAMGRRIQKTVITAQDTVHDYYVLDAQGNVLTIYTVHRGTDAAVPQLYVEEQMLYGSSRLGTWKRKEKIALTPPTTTVQTLSRGIKHYELSDHLGNVHTVFTDRKRPVCGGAIPRYYEAEVLNQYDYYAFGMLMEERKAAKPVCTAQRQAVQVTGLSMDFRAGNLHGFGAIGGATVTNLGGTDKLLVKKTAAGTGWGASKAGIALVQGVSYTISFDFGLGTCFGKTVRAQLKNGAGVVVATKDVGASGNASITGFVPSASGNYFLEFVMLGSAACEFTVDNVVVGYGSEKTLVSCGGGEGYRFGFNGQEKEGDISGVEGGHLSFGLRIEEARLGRFFAVDPLMAKYPSYTPYAYAQNKVVQYRELEGGQIFIGVLGIIKEGLKALTVESAKVQERHPDWNMFQIFVLAEVNVNGHTILDLAGMVPVIGEASDLTNAAWYYIDLDYINGTTSMASAIPIAGWFATGFKWTNKIIQASLKYGDEAAPLVQQTIKLYDESGKLGTEIITITKSGQRDDAYKIAKDIVGDLGEGAIIKEGKFGSQSDKVVGWQSADKKKGYRLDYDDIKGAHINWWKGKETGAVVFDAKREVVEMMIKNEIPLSTGR